MIFFSSYERKFEITMAQRDLQTLAKRRAIAAPLQSHNCSLGSWQPVCTNDRLPNTLQSYDCHVQYFLPASPVSQQRRPQTTATWLAEKDLSWNPTLDFCLDFGMVFLQSAYLRAKAKAGWRMSLTKRLLHPASLRAKALLDGLISPCMGRSLSSRQEENCSIGLEKRRLRSQRFVLFFPPAKCHSSLLSV